ncbi:MAG: Ig-like domain-containing protein [Candidatus Manganitrophus sp. SA1]|nr:Ig-like domain-containing protein [Candidatus Manganitrophus morganii]
MQFQPLLLFVLLLLAACGSGGGGEIGAPTVSETTPPNQATNVGVDSHITAKFSSSIDPVTVNDKTFIVIDMTGTVDYRDRMAIFTPSSPFETGRRYNAILTTGIKDLDGIPLRSNFTWAFETEGGPDTTAPSIVATVPRDRETNVSTTSSIRVVFSEPIDPSSIHQDTFFLNGGITGTYSYDDSSRTAIFTPSRPLASSTVTTVTVTKEVKDLAGNPLQSDLTWSFTTSATSDQTPPRVIARTPDENAERVSVNSNIIVTFDEDVDPVSIEPNFVLTGPSGEATPARLAYDVGSRTATLDPEADLASNTRYEVFVRRGIKDLSGNATTADLSWFFETGGITDITPPILTARHPEGEGVPVRTLVTVTFSKPIKPETLSGNFIVRISTGGTLSGQISYDAGSLTASFTPSRARLEYSSTYTVLLTQGIEDLAGNDLVQMSWTFTTIDPPQVAQMSPVGQEVSITPPPTIQATFSREMKESSINQSSFQVVNPAGAVPGTVSYANAVATFTPSTPILDNTLYRVTLTTAVEDLNGNPLPSNVQWEFHTAAPPDPAPSVASTEPANGTIDVSVNVSSVSVQFQRPVDPSSLPGQFTVRATSGNLLDGRIDYDAGQQRASFVFSGGPLAYNTSYTAALGAGVRSTSGMPMGSDFVWTFTTEAAPDATPPSVTGGDPADGARNVPATDLSGQPFQIRVDFSEPILSSTVTAATFVVRRVESEFDKPEISGTRRTESSSLFFVPSFPYDPGKTYEVTLTTGITDLAGNPLPSDVVRSLTTAP